MKEKEEKFELPNKIVKVKYNPHNPGPIKNPKHIAYVKLEGCYDAFGVGMARNGKLKNPFTKVEKEYLEEVTQRPNSLNIYNKEGILYDYDLMPIRIGKDPLILNLNDPEDYITYKVLLTNSDKICPDIKDVKSKKTYKYYIEDEDSVAEVKVTSSNKNKTAWKEFGKMEEDRDKMISFLKVYSQAFGKSFGSFTVNASSKVGLIASKVAEIIETDIDRFISLIQREDYDTILLVTESIEKKEIEKKGTKYFLKGGVDKLGDTLEQTCIYLDSPHNQELRLMLEHTVRKG